MFELGVRLSEKVDAQLAPVPIQASLTTLQTKQFDQDCIPRLHQARAI